MFAAAWKWLLGTATGRGVLIGGAVSIGMAIGWYVFSSHYETEGYNRCKAEYAEAQAKADREQAEKNAKNDKASSDITKDTTKAGENIVAAADKANADSKKEIEYVYRDPPQTAPVAFGSCVHPVDNRVQQEIGEAIRAANTPGR